MTTQNKLLIEAQLHHGSDGVCSVYNKTSYIELRREMTQAWSDYLDKLMQGATRVELEVVA